MLGRKAKIAVSAGVFLIISAFSLIHAFSQEQKNRTPSEAFRFAGKYIDMLVYIDTAQRRLSDTAKTKGDNEILHGMDLMRDARRGKGNLLQASISLSEFARSENTLIRETATTLLKAIELLMKDYEAKLEYCERLFSPAADAKDLQVQREQWNKWNDEQKTLHAQREKEAFDAIVLTAYTVYRTLLSPEPVEEGEAKYLTITAGQRKEFMEAMVDYWGETVKTGISTHQPYPCAAAAAFYELLAQPIMTADERGREKASAGNLKEVVSVAEEEMITDQNEAYGFAKNFIDMLTRVDAAEKGINQAAGTRSENTKVYWENLIKNIRQGRDTLQQAVRSLGGATTAQDSTIKEIATNLTLSLGMLMWNYSELLNYVEHLYDSAKATEEKRTMGTEMSEQSKLMATREELLNIFYTITPAVCGCLLDRTKDDERDGHPLVITLGQREQLKKAIVDYWGEDVIGEIKKNRNYTFYAADRFYSFLSQKRRTLDQNTNSLK